MDAHALVPEVHQTVGYGFHHRIFGGIFVKSFQDGDYRTVFDIAPLDEAVHYVLKGVQADLQLGDLLLEGLAGLAPLGVHGKGQCGKEQYNEYLFHHQK